MSKAEFLAQINNEETFKTILDEAFEEADKDKSGFIDRKELKAAINQILTNAKRPKIDEGQFNSEFQRFDLNGDGKISKEEFSVFVKEALTFYADIAFP